MIDLVLSLLRGITVIEGGYLLMAVAASWGMLVLARDGAHLLNHHGSNRALHQRHYARTVATATWEIAVVVLAAFALSIAIACVAPRAF